MPYNKENNKLFQLFLHQLTENFKAIVNVVVPGLAKGETKAVREVTGSREDLAGHNGDMVLQGIGPQLEDIYVFI